MISQETIKKCTSKVQENQETLEQHLSNGLPIYSNKDRTKELVLENDEHFEPCWNPTITRQTLPPCWFLSNKNHYLITMDGDVPVWYEPDIRANSKRWLYYNHINKCTKTIEMHNLIGLIYGADVYGKAKQLLEEKGVYAFGVAKTGELNVNGHHENDNHNDNAVENIQFVTTNVHQKVLNNIPNMNADSTKQMEYMKTVADVLSEEEPEKISVVFTPEYYDINTGTWNTDNKKYVKAVDGVYFTSNALNDLRKMIFFEK